MDEYSPNVDTTSGQNLDISFFDVIILPHRRYMFNRSIDAVGIHLSNHSIHHATTSIAIVSMCAKLLVCYLCLIFVPMEAKIV